MYIGLFLGLLTMRCGLTLPLTMRYSWLFLWKYNLAWLFLKWQCDAIPPMQNLQTLTMVGLVCWLEVFMSTAHLYIVRVVSPCWYHWSKSLGHRISYWWQVGWEQLSIALDLLASFTLALQTLTHTSPTLITKLTNSLWELNAKYMHT